MRPSFGGKFRVILPPCLLDWVQIAPVEVHLVVHLGSFSFAVAITFKASPEGLAKIDYARRMKGWKATSLAWCGLACVSVSTLKRFRRRTLIRQESFVAICEAVGVDWREVVDPESLGNQNSLAHASDNQLILVLSGKFHGSDQEKIETIVSHLKSFAMELEVTYGGGTEETSIDETQ